MGSWKRSFASGLIVIGPLLVTLYVVYRVYTIIAGIVPVFVLDETLLRGLIDHEPTRELAVHLLRAVVPVVVFLLVAVAVGSFTQTTIGDVFSQRLDEAANRIPVLRILYNASKIATETTLGEEKALQEPVRVESWDNIEMTAFKTGHTTEDGRLILFIPTAPNITSGFTVEASPDRVTETGESVEEALSRVLSGGFGESKHPQQTEPTIPLGSADDQSTTDD